MNMTFISKKYFMSGDIFKLSRKPYLMAALGINMKNIEIIM